MLAACAFAVILLSGAYSVRFPLGGRQWDGEIAREIVRVGYPLSGMQLIRMRGRFPFLFILANLGTSVVAAYAIARQVMLLAMMPAWGYSMASSTLVGQSIGAGREADATEYGWQTLRIALATQILIGGVLAVLARPITVVFGASSPGLTVEFIRVSGVGVVAYSVSRTMRGGLRGAGDTLWSLYGTILGTALRPPIVALGLPAGLAVMSLVGWTLVPGLGFELGGVYAAIPIEMYIATGHWKRRSGIGAGADTGTRAISSGRSDGSLWYRRFGVGLFHS